MFDDLRLACRSLAKVPGFTMAAVITLALGMGANTAIFSVVYAVLLDPLPFADPARLVSVQETLDGRPVTTSGASFDRWRGATRRLSALAAYSQDVRTLSGSGEPESAQICHVSSAFFATLGTPPALGRSLGAGDEGRPTVVISDEQWRRRFAGGANAVGAGLTIDGIAHTVVGVMPAAFVFPAGDVAAWVVRPATPDGPGVWMFGRLAPDATVDQVAEEAAAISKRLATPGRSRRTAIAVVAPLENLLVGAVRRGLWTLLAAVCGVLLLAAVNVGGLSLARIASRRGEHAVRMALGASRLRLARGLLAESLLLGLLGASVGIVLATVTIPLVIRLAGPDLPRAGAIGLRIPVLVFSGGTAFLSILLAGLFPAWQASATTPRDVLAERASGRQHTARAGRSRFVLVSVQSALATLLLIVALLFARSLATLLGVDADRPTQNVLTLPITLPAPAFANCYPDPACRARAAGYARDVEQAVRGVAGVRRASVTTSLPPHLSSMRFQAQDKDRATGREELYAFNIVTVGADYFRTLGIRAVKGRLFDENDTASSPPVFILSRDLARRHYGENPLGERMPFGPTDASGRPTPATLVGVVDDVKYGGLDQPTGGAIYVPFAQAPHDTFYVVALTDGAPSTVSARVRERVRAVNPTVPVGRPRTLEELRHQSVAGPESRAILLGCLAFLAIVLAAVGLYGNSRHATTERRFEIGVRMALGADRQSVFSLLARAGLVPVALGLAVGLAAAAGLSRLVGSLLFHVSPLDPATFLGVPVLLLAVAATAVSLPALRAAWTEPAVTLRE